MAAQSSDLYLGKFQPSSLMMGAAYGLSAIGVIAFIAGLMMDAERAWTSYLTSYFFFSCLAIGGLFFVSINHLTNAGWSVTVRRVAEGMTSFVPFILGGSLVLLAGLEVLYPWADAERVARDPLLEIKTPYLNFGFLVARWLIFGLGMILFTKIMVGRSLEQDRTGDVRLTERQSKSSVLFLLFFALMFSLFSVDLLMTLLPHWFSTIFGIYCFAGMAQSSFATMILMAIYLQRKGLVRGYINVEHIHDLAKYLKGFTIFWAYIAFSQFMLIWYTNIPEETEYYMLRGMGGWMSVSLALIIFKFLVPFLALLPRAAKRSYSHLVAVCILILVMSWVDVYWMVYPNFFDNQVTFGIWEIGLFLGFLGLFMLTWFRFMARNNLVAIKDPRMDEALKHHVTY